MANIKSAKRKSPQALYAEIERRLRDHYWDKDALVNIPAQPAVITKADFEQAVVKLLALLGNRYTVYHEPASSRAIDRTRSSVIEGVGVLIGPQLEDRNPLRTKRGKLRPDRSATGFPVLLDVFAGTPAARAGLCKGDEILSIDGAGTRQIQTLLTVVNRIRGPRNSVLELCVRRQGIVENVKIVRDKYWIPSVEANAASSATVENDGALDCQSSATKAGVGYLKIVNFHDPQMPNLVQLTLRNLVDCRGLVLDLRDNGGGYVSNAVDVAACFVQRGTVLHQELRQGSGLCVTQIQLTEEAQYTKINGHAGAPSARRFSRLWQKPIVVLVNSKTASAAELLAGTLQEVTGAYLIGERSFGKGIIQSRFNLANRGSIEITSGIYKLPSGRWVGDADRNRFGVEPDLVIPGGVNSDEQFQAALTHLAHLKA